MEEQPLIYDRIEPEELDEIEYFEILTVEEIIKDNPNFKAFSKEEIYDELFDFFKDSNKAKNITDLFFKNDNNNTDNLVFVADASLKDDVSDDEDCDNHYIDFVEKKNKISKLQFALAQKENDKLFLSIFYDNHSKRLRLKPSVNTNIEMHIDGGKKSFKLLDTDNVNIPINSVYYKKPVTSQSNYISSKILSKYDKPVNMNLVKTDNFTKLNKVIKLVKPRFTSVLKDIKINDLDEINYSTLDNILSLYDISFDDLKESDFTELNNELIKLLQSNEFKTNYNKPKINIPNTINKKLNFYNNISNILKFLNNNTEELEQAITKLQDEKVNINFPGLIYNNTEDIINALENNDVTLERILENISDYQKLNIIDKTIQCLNDILTNDLDNTTELLENITKKEEVFKRKYRDIYPLHFIDFYNDVKEIKEADNFDNYEGIPPVFTNEPNFEGMVKVDNVEDIPINNNISKIDILSLHKYKNAKGFKEYLEIILELFENIKNNSKLNIDFEMLSHELYKRFSGVSTKYDILYDIIMKNNLIQYKESVNDLIKLSPNAVFNFMENNEITPYLRECNEIFINTLFDMIYHGLTWWSIQVLEDYSNEFLVFDENNLLVEYVDKWSLTGVPLDKTASDGVLVYLSEITKDILEEKAEYLVPKNILKSCIKIIESDYQNEIENLKINIQSVEKQNKGRETYKILKHSLKENKNNRLLNDYVNALLYMPGYKFKKIHKFLLGCCLQKIGPEFIPDSDLIAINRTDLRDAKNKYSDKRYSIKSHKTMFYIPNDEQLQDTVDNKKIKLNVPIPNTIDFTSFLENTVNALLPKHIIDMIKEQGAKSIEPLYNKYLEVFIKTTGVKNTNKFDKQIKETTSYVNILLHLNKIFFTLDGNDNEKVLFNNAISSIIDIRKLLKQLYSFQTDENKYEIMHIKNYILIRALCLPFNPDTPVNGLLIASIQTKADFVKTVTKKIYGDISKYLNNISMPTIEDNVHFINSIREINKNKILDKMNTLTQEERNLFEQLKGIGIKTFEEDDDNTKVNIQPQIDDDEFDLNGEEEDDENMDREEYGFIYS